MEDENIKKEFLTSYDAQHRIVSESGKPSVLVVGLNDWPFPIPLVQRDGQWSFDTAAGREEILARRIGRNELGAMKASLAYWDAQNEYADMFKDKNGMAVYAQKIVSSPGKRTACTGRRRAANRTVRSVRRSLPQPSGAIASAPESLITATTSGS